jgi:hypothetical protein
LSSPSSPSSPSSSSARGTSDRVRAIEQAEPRARGLRTNPSWRAQPKKDGAASGVPHRRGGGTRRTRARAVRRSARLREKRGNGMKQKKQTAASSRGRAR